MAANYPADPNPQYRASSRQFFYSLRHMLPCEVCRVHYSALIAKRQPQTDSAQALQEWVLWLHNEVNQRVKPGQPEWTLDQLRKTYGEPWKAAPTTAPSVTHLPLSNAVPLPAKTSTKGSTVVDSSPPGALQQILKPLEDLHAMLFPGAEPVSPRSKTLSMSLASARQLHSKLADARRTGGGKSESDLGFSPDSKLPMYGPRSHSRVTVSPPHSRVVASPALPHPPPPTRAVSPRRVTSFSRASAARPRLRNAPLRRHYQVTRKPNAPTRSAQGVPKAQWKAVSKNISAAAAKPPLTPAAATPAVPCAEGTASKKDCGCKK